MPCEGEGYRLDLGAVVPVHDADLEYAWFFRAEFPGVLRTVFLIP